MFIYYNIHTCGGEGGGESSARPCPSSGAAPLLPLGPAGMFSILAPTPERNQMGQSKKFRDFYLHSVKVTLQITSLLKKREKSPMSPPKRRNMNLENFCSSARTSQSKKK